MRNPESARTGTPALALLIPFLVCSLSLLFEMPVFLRVLMGVPLVFVLPGITTMLALGLRENPREDYVYMPLLLSPIVMSLVMLAFSAATGSTILAMKASVLLFLVAFVALAVARKASVAGRTDGVPREIYAISILFCLFLVAAFVANPYLLIRSDTFFHASVLNEIQARGIPPMEPRLPDIPIKYYWMYHFFLNGWKALSGLPLFWVLFSFTLLNAFAFPYLMARFTRIFTDDRAKLISTPLFAIAGLGAAAWILCPLFVLRAFTGEVTGVAELRRTWGGFEFDSHKVIYALTPYGTSLTNVLDKYFTITSYTYSISLFFLCAVSVLGGDLFRKGRIRYIAFLVLVFAGNFLFQILTGTALIMMAVGSAVLMAILYARERKTPPAFNALVVPGVAIASTLLVLPYVRSLGSVGEGSGAFKQFVHFGRANLLSMLAPCVALAPFSYRAARKLAASKDERWRIAAAWIASLFVVAVFFNAGGMAEVKLAFFFLQLLLPFVAWELIDSLRRTTGKRKALLVAWIAFLFVVPTVLTVRGFLLDRPSNEDERHAYSLNDDDRALIDWVKTNTGVNAVMLEHKSYNIMPVYAGRRNFYSEHSSLLTFGYDDATSKRYQSIYYDVYSPEPIKREDIEFLRERGFDLFIVVWDIDMERSPWIAAKLDAASGDFEKVYQGASGVIYRFKKPPPAPAAHPS